MFFLNFNRILLDKAKNRDLGFTSARYSLAVLSQLFDNSEFNYT